MDCRFDGGGNDAHPPHDYLPGYALSVAVALGSLALAGVAAGFGVVMMRYLDETVRRHPPATLRELRAAVIEGAVQRVRPMAMTAAATLCGRLPVMSAAGPVPESCGALPHRWSAV